MNGDRFLIYRLLLYRSLNIMLKSNVAPAHPIAAELQGIVIMIKNKNSVLSHKIFETFPTISILFENNIANDICKLNNNVTSQVKINKKDR